MSIRAPNFWLVGLWATLPLLAYSFSRDRSVVDSVLANKTIFLTLYSLLIAAPLWVAYGRLNGLDSSDGLKPSQSVGVSDFALAAKRLLLQKLLFSVFCVFLTTVAISVDSLFPLFGGWLSAIAISAVLIYFVHAVFNICSALLRIEKTLKSVNKWRAEQKERGKQVAELKKARSERKLIPDEKLLGYRELAAEEVVAPVSEASDSKAARKKGKQS